MSDPLFYMFMLYEQGGCLRFSLCFYVVISRTLSWCLASWVYNYGHYKNVYICNAYLQRIMRCRNILQRTLSCRIRDAKNRVADFLQRWSTLRCRNLQRIGRCSIVGYANSLMKNCNAQCVAENICNAISVAVCHYTVGISSYSATLYALQNAATQRWLALQKICNPVFCIAKSATQSALQIISATHNALQLCVADTHFFL